MTIVINTPRVGHRIELDGRKVITEDGPPVRFQYFEEIRLYRGDITIHWRVDERTAADLVPIPVLTCPPI